jgi:hypothetical protein
VGGGAQPKGPANPCKLKESTPQINRFD